ncbi:MAG: selenoprotein B glycine/betaine/sarcosine/D-proline reductase [Proteobacteria bacterium]|nr:selenoprotein B glycine/betaine/sarcosine/D-proline reductase [Pseudomonadota bacterium]
MARLEDFDPTSHKHLADMPMPTFASTPWTTPKPAAQSRVAIISTAGLQRRGDAPFAVGSGDYRLLPGDLDARDLVMSHISTNFDRTGFQEDHNVVFPIDRLKELAHEGDIGSVASMHYAFMGATPPSGIERPARQLAGLLKQDQVDAVLLVPV